MVSPNDLENGIGASVDDQDDDDDKTTAVSLKVPETEARSTLKRSLSNLSIPKMLQPKKESDKRYDKVSDVFLKTDVHGFSEW